MCGHGEGVSRGGKARAARVPLRPWKRPRPTVCVCAPHSPAHFVGRAAREAGAGSGVRERREPARAARAVPSASASSCVCVRSPGWRGERRALEPKEMRRRSHKFADGGALPADEKSSNKVFQSQAQRGRPGGEPEACVSTGARVPREARLPHASRAWSKREKGDRPKGTDSRGGAPDARRKPTLFKTTRRAQSPRRRACCKVFRLRRRGGRWVGGKWGEALERRAATSTASTSRGAGAREGARSGSCRPPPG